MIIKVISNVRFTEAPLHVAQVFLFSF